MTPASELTAEPEEAPPAAPPWLQATVDDLGAVDIDAPLAGLTIADYHEAATAFRKAAEHAEASQEHAASRVLSMLGAALDIRLTTSNPQMPFEPMAVFDDRRSAIPTDFRGNIETLAAMAERSGSALVRSRLGDLCWFLERRRRASALMAVSAYIELVESLAAGKMTVRFAKDHPANAFNHESARLLRRALQITRWLKGEEPELAAPGALAVLLRLESAAAKDAAALRRFAKLDLDFGLSDPIEVAAAVEVLINGVGGALDLDTQVELWRLTARAYQAAKRDEDRYRCRAMAAEALVKTADARGSAFVVSKFLADAISELHGIPAMKERRKELQHRLVDAQSAILDEMSVFRHEANITDIVDATKSAFEHLDLVDMLFAFIGLAAPQAPEKLIKEAQELIRAHPLSSLFGTSHLDESGKVIHRTDGGGFGDDGSSAAVDAKIAQAESMRRSLVVGGGIEPARQIMMSRYFIAEDVLELIARNSAFVDPRQEDTFAKGMARFFSGDRVGAIYILTPLLESSLRFVLKTAGHDVTTFDAATQTQQDRMLTSLFADMRKPMEEVFSPEIVNDLDLVFLKRPGPALRHAVVHGLLTDGGPYGADAIYACWMMFALMLMPLAPAKEDLRQALSRMA